MNLFKDFPLTITAFAVAAVLFVLAFTHGPTATQNDNFVPQSLGTVPAGWQLQPAAKVGHYQNQFVQE